MLKEELKVQRGKSTQRFFFTISNIYYLFIMKVKGILYFIIFYFIIFKKHTALQFIVCNYFKLTIFSYLNLKK